MCIYIFLFFVYPHVRKHGNCANFHVRWCMEGNVCAVLFIIPGGKWAARMVIYEFRSRRPAWDGLLGCWALSPCPAWCQCATWGAELHLVWKLNFSSPGLHQGSTKPPAFPHLCGGRFYAKSSPKQREFYQPWVCHSADLDGVFLALRISQS